MEGSPVVLAGVGMSVTNGVKIGITYVLFTFEASGHLLHADGEVYYLLVRYIFVLPEGSVICSGVPFLLFNVATMMRVYYFCMLIGWCKKVCKMLRKYNKKYHPQFGGRAAILAPVGMFALCMTLQNTSTESTDFEGRQ